MSTPHKANRNTAIKTTGRTLVGVGVTGAVALTGAGFGQAQPHIDNQRENSGPDTDLDALLKQLATTNQDLATLQHQLGQDQERANKVLASVQLMLKKKLMLQLLNLPLHKKMYCAHNSS